MRDPVWEQWMRHEAQEAAVPRPHSLSAMDMISRGNAVAGDLIFSLHQAAVYPGENQDHHEVRYGGYHRQHVPRTPAWFAVQGAVATLMQPIEFPACYEGNSVATYFGVSLDDQTLIMSGALGVTVHIHPGDVFQLRAGSTLADLR